MCVQKYQYPFYHLCIRVSLVLNTNSHFRLKETTTKTLKVPNCSIKWLKSLWIFLFIFFIQNYNKFSFGMFVYSMYCCQFLRFSFQLPLYSTAFPIRFELNVTHSHLIERLMLIKTMNRPINSKQNHQITINCNLKCRLHLFMKLQLKYLIETKSQYKLISNERLLPKSN